MQFQSKLLKVIYSQYALLSFVKQRISRDDLPVQSHLVQVEAECSVPEQSCGHLGVASSTRRQTRGLSSLMNRLESEQRQHMIKSTFGGAGAVAQLGKPLPAILVSLMSTHRIPGCFTSYLVPC